MPNFKLLTLCLAVIGFSAIFSVAHAQDLLPPASTTEIGDSVLATHPMLRLTPEKSELLRLDRDAISVVVGNPTHLSVMMDTPRLLVLVPRAPGATHFTVLDKKGEVIMQRHVIVAAPKENYIRVRRSCANAGTDSACRATSVYFCPDMCHEIDVTQMGEETVQAASPEEAPSSGASNSPAPSSAASTPVLEEQTE